MKNVNNVVAILNDGNSVIVRDDHCYAIRNLIDGEWKWSAWIFKEALEVIKNLPENPDNAVILKGENNE